MAPYIAPKDTALNNNNNNNSTSKNKEKLWCSL